LFRGHGNDLATKSRKLKPVAIHMRKIGVILVAMPCRADTIVVAGAGHGCDIPALDQVNIVTGRGRLMIGREPGAPDEISLDRDQEAWKSPRERGCMRSLITAKPDIRTKFCKRRATDGVDIILEMLANVNLSHDTKLLANNGRIIVIGSRGEVTINPRELMGRRASIRGFTLWGITPTEEADIHAGIFAGLENGTLRPVVGKELPLADASRAHKEILEPGSAGKIVLIC
jgi:Zinc-binding dehydrogenase